jgi:hypothetical protein
MGDRARRGFVAAMAILGVGLLGAACRSGNQTPAVGTSETPAAHTGQSVTATTSPTTAPSPSDSTAPTNLRNAAPEDFDPADFGEPTAGANEWIPLKPGWQTVRKGLVNVGNRRLEHIRVYTITDVSKKIAGVRTVAVLDQDFNAGQLAEQAIDYLAEDVHGNVWYMGSYTETYEGGQFVNATDGWLAGVSGSQPGILMEALPKAGLSYFESNALGEGPTDAKVVKTGGSKCVPFECYRDVVVIQEGTSGEVEYKYYARGVGGILTEPHYSGGEQETELLINVRQLSPQGLAELATEVMRLDRHARDVIPDVFANSSQARRTL